MLIDKNEKMQCLNCKYFEERTSFCRKHPPQVVIVNQNGKDYINSIFPKISFPEFDYCHEYVGID